MTSFPSPLVTPLPRRGTSGPNGTDADADTLSALRQELQNLTTTVADLTSKGAARAGELATAGTQRVRQDIEANPWTSIAIAAAAGAIIAFAVIPKRPRGFRYNDRASYTMDDIGASLRQAAPRAGITQSLVARLERVVDSISTIDPAAVTASPAYETAKTWIQTLLNGVRKP